MPTPEPQITGPIGPTPTARPSDRVKVREYLAPWWPENYASIRIGPKYINAVVGGLDQGSGLPVGIEFTTADKISWVELRAPALTSTLGYVRGKLEAHFPHVGDERTRANVWFNYLLANQWNFYGIGPRTPQEQRTSFQLEQRSYNGLLERFFTNHFKAGVYAGLANAGSQNGNNENVSNINAFFSGFPTVTPITAWEPGLNMNSEILYYGLFGEIDGRNNKRGLTKGFYSSGGSAPMTGWIMAPSLTTSAGSGRYSTGAFTFRSAATRLRSRRAPTPRWKTRRAAARFRSTINHSSAGACFCADSAPIASRADNALLLSAELRQTIWKMNDENTRGIDIHAFGDGGQVWGDNRSNTNPVVLANDEFRSENWRFGVGVGLTYRHNRAFAVRIELGHSNESNLVYLSLTRGF